MGSDQASGEMKHIKDCELGENWRECPACVDNLCADGPAIRAEHLRAHVTASQAQKDGYVLGRVVPAGGSWPNLQRAVTDGLAVYGKELTTAVLARLADDIEGEWGHKESVPAVARQYARHIAAFVRNWKPERRGEAIQ